MHAHHVNIIALIACVGLVVQWAAWRFRIPAIVLLTAAGFVVGPATGLINPSRDFGNLLEPFVQLAVAVILFEGGLNLRIQNFQGVPENARTLI